MPLDRNTDRRDRAGKRWAAQGCEGGCAAEPDFTASFRVTAVPTVFLFRGGQRVAQFTGAKSKRDIKKWIDESVSRK